MSLDGVTDCCKVKTRRFLVFAGSMCDVFEDWPGLIVGKDGCAILEAKGYRLATTADLRRDLFHLIDQTPNLDWILCTKRPENVRKMWEIVPGRDNITLLYSASDQETLEAGLPHLLECRDLVKHVGLILEPLVGPMNFKIWPKRFPSADMWLNTLTGETGSGRHTHSPAREYSDKVDWVIVGGESGPHARPCNIEWIRDIVAQCKRGGVRCFVKQVGSNAIYDDEGDTGNETIVSYHTDHPKGGDPSEWPESLKVQEYPR